MTGSTTCVLFANDQSKKIKLSQNASNIIPIILIVFLSIIIGLYIHYKMVCLVVITSILETPRKSKIILMYQPICLDKHVIIAAIVFPK